MIYLGYPKKYLKLFPIFFWMQKNTCYNKNGGTKMTTKVKAKAKEKEMVKMPTSVATTVHMTEIMKRNLEAIKMKQHEASGIKLNNSGAVALALAFYAQSLGGSK